MKACKALQRDPRPYKQERRYPGGRSRVFIPILKQVEAQEGRVMCRRESCRSENGGAGSHDKPRLYPVLCPLQGRGLKRHKTRMHFPGAQGKLRTLSKPDFNTCQANKALRKFRRAMIGILPLKTLNELPL